MDIHDRLNGYAMTKASWIPWLLLGYSTGGLAILLERAFYLVSRSRRVRRVVFRLLDRVPAWRRARQRRLADCRGVRSSTGVPCSSSSGLIPRPVWLG